MSGRGGRRRPPIALRGYRDRGGAVSGSDRRQDWRRAPPPSIHAARSMLRRKEDDGWTGKSKARSGATSLDSRSLARAAAAAAAGHTTRPVAQPPSPKDFAIITGT